MHKLNVRLGDYNHGFTIRQTQDREELLEVAWTTCKTIQQPHHPTNDLLILFQFMIDLLSETNKIVQNIGIGTKFIITKSNR